MKSSRASCLVKILIIIFITLIFVTSLYAILFFFPQQARALYGDESPDLSRINRITYSIRLVLQQQSLLETSPRTGPLSEFDVSSGETVNSVSIRLEQRGIITSAESFRDYLVYSGMDRTIKSGSYQITSDMNAVAIAHLMQDATPHEISFHILNGWRAEEIGNSLLTSGLTFSKEEFLAIVQNPTALQLPSLIANQRSLEGYLFPGEYTFARDISPEVMINQILIRFTESISSDMLGAYQQRGLSLKDAVVLASMVQREAMHEEEMPLIASVFFNRLSAGMKLDSDPTVQYALGYYQSQNTWWKNPLQWDDMQIESPFNTYRYVGLPPAPICEPGMAALLAVASPSESPYFYFRAACDGSGLHQFAITYEEHVENGCP
jgi:UPF0755 protein